MVGYRSNQGSPQDFRSYTREFKLKALEWYETNGRNISATARQFKVAPKRIREWESLKEHIQNQAGGCRSKGRGRSSFFPLMEKQLHKEFRQQRLEGKRVKWWWFTARAKVLMKELYPDVSNFKFSEHWFRRFRVRFNLSFRKKTHVAQKAPHALVQAITNFHQKIHAVRESGVFSAADLANMDQTPLPFVLDDGKTYNETGAKEVWCASAASGLEKRQCTVQLTVFADGISRVSPLIVFRGQGKRLAKKEKDGWDPRVRVMFQVNAWSDGAVRKEWIESEWGNVFTNSPSSSTGKILVADMHRAQQTDEVIELLRQHKTIMVSIPAGCTSHIQPLGVCINKPFKDTVRAEHERHQQENLNLYTENKMSTSERHILITKWVVNAWQKVCSNKDMVIRPFKNCGISVNLDGSEDKNVNIEGLPDYKYQMMVDESDDNELVEAGCNAAASAAEIESVDEGDDDEVMATVEPAGNTPAVETMDFGD